MPSAPVDARHMPAEKDRDWQCRTICYANPSKKFSGQDPDTCRLFHIEAEARLPQQRKSPPFLKRSEGEQMAKQSKVGFNAQEGFTEVDESGNVKN